jgi:hypothetical protein
MCSARDELLLIEVPASIDADIPPEHPEKWTLTIENSQKVNQWLML